MIDKDINNYAQENWAGFLNTVSELSDGDPAGAPLVISDCLLFNFDTITKSIFPNDECPSSVDALFIDNERIALIEFKKGFCQKITKKSFDVSKGKCDYIFNNYNGDEYVCNDYWDVFLKNQRKMFDQLIDNLKLKAVESYITLEKKILPLCSFQQPAVSLDLVIVIDADPVDAIEDIYGELAGKQTTDNQFDVIKKSLRRFTRKQDNNYNDYYYDSITVVSPGTFLQERFEIKRFK